MADIKLTKNDLRLQQNRLAQLEKYLPTLQLKKAMLQIEVNEARMQIAGLEDAHRALREHVEEFSPIMTERTSFNPLTGVRVAEVQKRYENIAGVEVPEFIGVVFQEEHYDLFDTPPWVDSVVDNLKQLAQAKEEVKIAQEKKAALEHELREVSIRVNLFEKILIPRSISNIKKIKVFLGDQQLAAVSQAKAAKSKIEKNKMAVDSSWRDHEKEQLYAY